VCSPLPPLRRLLENQLPMITQGQRGFNWPSYAATSTVPPLLLVVRLYSIVVQLGGMSASRSTAAACTSPQERNRSSFVGCASSLT
jgi:hypothetical protein